MTIELLRKARELVWSKMPEEIRSILSKRGLLLPAGIILYAESDTRNFHEILWEIYNRVSKGKVKGSELKFMLLTLLDYYERKMSGWYHLNEIASVLANARKIIENATTLEEYIEVVRELMLYIGRISMWLDLLIPWYEINEVIKKMRI